MVWFTPDGDRLVRLDGTATLRLMTHDARTVRCVNDGALEIPTGDGLHAVRDVVLSPDGRRVAVAQATSQGSGGWELFDAATGDCMTPLVGAPAQAVRLTFSPCGRWLLPEHAWYNGRGVAFGMYDATTGRGVLEIDRGCCQIVARGDAAAVLWAGSPPAVELRDLPGGRVRTRFPLPAGIGFPRNHDWRGDMLLIQYAPSKSSGWGNRYYEFDTAADPVGPGVERPDLAEPYDRDGWRLSETPGRFRVQRPLRDRRDGFPHPWLARASARVGQTYDGPDGYEWRVRPLDPATGVEHGRSAWPAGWPVVSPDGRRVAEPGDGTFAIWPYQPWPRGAVALIAAGPAVLIGSGIRRWPRGRRPTTAEQAAGFNSASP